MKFDELSRSDKDIALDEFAVAFRHYLDSESLLEDCKTKERVLERVRERIGGEGKFHPRQFEILVKQLYSHRYLQVTARTLVEEAENLRNKFVKLTGVTVVSGSSQHQFSQVAATEFIKEIGRIGANKQGDESPICIGIMSGTTTERVVNSASLLSWEKLDVDPKQLPLIKLFPLNVSFTDPAYLSGNATILNFILANTINEQGGKAEAYGLNAPLTVEKSRLEEVDSVTQTKEVLRYTDPARINEGEQGPKEEDGDAPLTDADDEPAESITHLDLILTGVGEKPKDESGGSIFYKLAQENGIDIVQFEQQRVVGDIAFIPLRSDGAPAELQNAGGKDVAFYSTISLGILRSMARDRNKSVILCAQSSPQKYKIPVLFASIGGPAAELEPYVSHMIVDGPTAKDLIRF